MSISVIVWGGLGNQLFQILTVISTAKEHKLQFLFKKDIDYFSRRKTYWNSFLKNLKPYTVDSIDYTTPFVFDTGDRDQYSLCPIPEKSLSPKDLYLLIGYFQSYKYFDHDFEYIYTLLGIDDFKRDLSSAYAPLLHTTNTIVSLHFRIGDYDKKDILGLDYYSTALSKLTGPHRIICFGEKENLYEIQDRVDALRRRFPTFEFLLADFDCEDWQQVVLMSLCRHNIIANSTFSYFGAYFNTHKDKQVFYPDILKTECPESWTKIESLSPTTT